MFIKNMFLILQLENYQTIIFVKKFYSNINLWTSKIHRSELDLTNKLKFLGTIYLIINILLIHLIYTGLNIYSVIYLVMLIIAQPLILGISNILIYPIDTTIKNIIINKAKNKLKRYDKLIKIGITGSYGKTSQKEILTKVLSSKYKVLCTTGNENTPLGISRLILDKLDQTYDVLIVEMGAYYPGDIAQLCDIINPQIAILTGITKQHLQRFGNIENIISTKFELFDNLEKGGTGYYDTNSYETKVGIDRFKNTKNINLQGINGNIDFTYKENFQGINFEYNNQIFNTKLLAPHNMLQIITAYEIGKKLGIPSKQMIESIENLDYIKHRLELIYNPNNGVYVLDDSYNGNIKGVESIISMFEKINYQGRKIYLTPGIVELGDEDEKIHLELGKKLGKTFDLYILIKNKSTLALCRGLISSGVNSENIVFCDSTLQAHNDLKNILRKGDIIVFQNDWTENYFL